MENTAIDLAIHMSHPGPEHWKELGSLIGYLKGKEPNVFTVINPKFIEAVIFL